MSSSHARAPLIISTLGDIPTLGDIGPHFWNGVLIKSACLKLQDALLQERQLWDDLEDVKWATAGY